MNKIYLLILTVVLFVTNGFGQVTVTNRTNAIPALAATYGTLAAAITALNSITGITGPVIITLNAGFPQTAPAGGYVIQFAATTSAATGITIEGNNNIITASAALTAGVISDAIFKLVGVDYITLQHFTMQENPANTISATAPTNNMTEWGVALLHSSVTNGAQNNTIQNNTIALNKTYRNTFGIYTNARHSSANTASAPLTVDEPTAVSGSNSGNKFYANNISNVMFGITCLGSVTASFMDAGNDIGGSDATTGNTITNFGGNSQLSSYVGNVSGSYCIYSNHQTADNISYNGINNGAPVGTGVASAFIGIRKEYATTAPVGTFTSTISYNTITLASDFVANGTLTGINNFGLTLSTATMNITNNNIINCTSLNGSDFYGIRNLSAPGTLNMANNIVRGLNMPSGIFTGISNSGAVVNTININSNKIGDAVAGAATITSTSSGSLTGITNSGGASTATVYLNNNSLDGFAVVNMGAINFIQNTAGSVAAVNMNSNQLGTVTGSLISFSGIQSSAFAGIYNPNGNTAMAVSIQNNDIRGIINAVNASATCQLIATLAVAQSTLIDNNTFTNLNIKMSSLVQLIYKAGNMAAGASTTITNNRLVGTFSTSSGNNVYMCFNGGFSPTGSTTTITGNDFSNITLTSGATFFGIQDNDGSAAAGSPTKTISGNIINNVTMINTAGTFWGVAISKGENSSTNSNTVSNISASGQVYGLTHGSAGTGTLNVSNNTISSLSSTISFVYGMNTGSTLPTVMNINGNSITGLSSGGTNVTVVGLLHTNGPSTNIYNNNFSNLSHTGGGNSIIHGIWISGGTTTNIHNNNINSLLHSGAATSSPAVNGILIANGTTVTAYNNFISNLNASNASSTDAIRGISVTSTTASTNYNLYYNSIYFNGASSGTNFGTSGIYHTANATSTTAALNMINNIIVNTSTANGTGVTAAYRRSGTALDNYAAASDYNLFYAGIPSASKLIFYDGTNSDQTLAAYQTRVSTRDANSISVMPTFTSSTDLHLTPANCRIDGRGTPVGAVTFDFDLGARNATNPDIGADEFTGTSSLILPATSVCEDRTVPVSGAIYTNNACNPIARIVPSGANPVAGNVNVCVTLDATQQTFNGEPYVQRHFDVEPVTSNETTTSATITLYIANQEFVDYNTNNPAWPKMPTSLQGNADANRFNVKVTQFHGVASTSPSSPGNYPGLRVLTTITNVFWNGNYWEVTFPVTGFSGFYVHTNNFNTPLPISVNYLNGRRQNGNHLLDWKVTCVSTPRATMTLERSTDARNFTGIYTITADAGRCNQPFDYTDVNPLNGMNYYRLKIVDADGKVTYSTTVALLNAAKGFDIISIAPNPVVTDNFKLNVTNAQASKMDISIFDMQGRLVNRQTVSVIAGFNSLPVNVSQLADGTYTIQVTVADEKSRVVRFVKQ